MEGGNAAFPFGYFKLIRTDRQKPIQCKRNANKKRFTLAPLGVE